MEENILLEAKQEFDTLISSFSSIQIASVDKNGLPEVSYSPSVLDNYNNFYVYVSELSKHTENMLNNCNVSLMIIEDETLADIIFARKRVTFSCQAIPIKRDTEEWLDIMNRFQEKFGPMMKQLIKMKDFHLIKLKPSFGRLVYGFGKAFDIQGNNMDDIVHVKGFNQKGHKIGE